MLSNTPLGIGPVIDRFDRLDDDTELDVVATVLTEPAEGPAGLHVRRLSKDILRGIPRNQ